MGHLSFNYKGYGIYLANIQPSKARMGGGKIRSMQIILDGRIRKSIRYDRTDTYGYGKASKKATEWIDQQIEKQNNEKLNN